MGGLSPTESWARGWVYRSPHQQIKLRHRFAGKVLEFTFSELSGTPKLKRQGELLSLP